MRKAVPVMKSVAGWGEANRDCNTHRLPKPMEREAKTPGHVIWVTSFGLR
jgi:hypothetical protein